MDAPLDTSQVNFQMDEIFRLECESTLIDTPYGGVSVSVKGERGSPAIVTYHDIGLNHQSNFGSFLSNYSMEALASRFTWYHIDAPGQEVGAEKLSPDFAYPTMTQLAEQIEYVVEYYQLGYFIGLGVGAGANVLARYAMLNPERVSGLVLVNFEPQALSWTSPVWLSGKAAKWQLKGRESGIPRLATLHLRQHTFGSKTDSDSDLVRAFTEELEGQQPNNLGLFMDSFYSRSSITGDFSKLIECPCLFVVSGSFAHKDVLVKLASLLPPQKSTYLELSNTSGLLLDDQPTKLAVAFKLFLQGLGLAPSISSHTCPSLHTSIVLEGTPAVLHPTVVA